jgi:hypothetical protein
MASSFPFKLGTSRKNLVRMVEEESKSDMEANIGVASLTSADHDDTNERFKMEFAEVPTPNLYDCTPNLYARRKGSECITTVTSIDELEADNDFRPGYEDWKIDEPVSMEQSCLSPIGRFNLSRAGSFTSNPIDRELSNSDLIDRREFILVVAAALQKFGAAAHHTEEYSDALAKVKALIAIPICRLKWKASCIDYIFFNAEMVDDLSNPLI